MKTISIFGSTGSIGTSTLDIIRNAPEKYNVKLLTAHSNWQTLAAQAREFEPDIVVLANDDHLADLQNALSGTNIEVLAGEEALCDAAGIKVDLHMAAIVGIAGLKPVFAAPGQAALLSRHGRLHLSAVSAQMAWADSQIHRFAASLSRSANWHARSSQ